MKLSCPICFENYREGSNPVIASTLSCGHTACITCLIKISNVHHPECHICRTQLKDQSFNRNFLIMSIVSKDIDLDNVDDCDKEIVELMRSELIVREKDAERLNRELQNALMDVIYLKKKLLDKSNEIARIKVAMNEKDAVIRKHRDTLSQIQNFLGNETSGPRGKRFQRE